MYRIEAENEDYDKNRYTEISNLNHYDRQIRIRGRVVKKTGLRRFKTKDGRDSCVFSIIILDESRTIQGTFFRELADKFFSVIEEGCIYSFYEMDIRNASKFNTTSNKLELVFNERTEIKRLQEDRSIKGNAFNFVRIADIEGKQENDVIDVIAVIQDPGAVKDIQLKTGDVKEKRVLRLQDDSGYSIDLTIWGESATNPDLQRGSIVVF